MLRYRKYADAQGSRFAEILAGCFLGIFGLAFAGFGTVGAFKVLLDDSLNHKFLVISLIAAVVGVFSLTIAHRLIAGSGRKSDGGLFPPWLLRLLGVMFLSSAVWIVYSIDEHFAMPLGALTLGLGCFYLANRQQRARQTFTPTDNDT